MEKLRRIAQCIHFFFRTFYRTFQICGKRYCQTLLMLENVNKLTDGGDKKHQKTVKHHHKTLSMTKEDTKINAC
jgi:hypothetical protein